MSASRQQNMYLNVDLRKLDCEAPKLKPPEEIGSYSLDIDQKFENSKKSLRYFVKPPNLKNVNFDLRKGYDTRIIKPHGIELHILRWMTENLDKFSIDSDEGNTRQYAGASGSDAGSIDTRRHRQEKVVDQDSTGQELDDVQAGLSKLKIDKDKERSDKVLDKKPRNLNTDFVCRRGVLARIMLTPYEEREEWFIAVTLHNGTYYVQEIVSEEKRRREELVKDDEMSCWGWKFEQYLTAECMDGKPDTDKPYNNCEKFYTVVKTQLHNHSLVISGVAEAINTDGDYMEFKTNKEFRHEGHEKTFKRYKTKKFWAQSHLTGVKEIVCGFRNENGVVKRLEIYKTDDLPRISSGIYNAWKANVCTNFLDKFLSFVKSSIKTDDHKIVHTLKWKPSTGRIECSPPLTDSEYDFLPEWYITGSA